MLTGRVHVPGGAQGRYDTVFGYGRTRTRSVPLELLAHRGEGAICYCGSALNTQADALASAAGFACSRGTGPRHGFWG